MSEQWTTGLLVGMGDPWRHWMACAHPERKPDQWTKFHLDCRPCLIAVEAATRVQPAPGEFQGWWDSRDEIMDMMNRTVPDRGESDG